MTEYTNDQLYQELDRLTLFQRIHGRGHNPDAAEVRHYCKTIRKKIKAELKQRGLPSRRPGDTRVYGPGQTAWQGRRV